LVNHFKPIFYYTAHRAWNKQTMKYSPHLTAMGVREITTNILLQCIDCWHCWFSNGKL